MSGTSADIDWNIGGSNRETVFNTLYNTTTIFKRIENSFAANKAQRKVEIFNIFY